MKQERRHDNCPNAAKPWPYNPTPGVMRAAFITLGERKHRVGYICLDCGSFEFEPDIGWLIALRERENRHRCAPVPGGPRWPVGSSGGTDAISTPPKGV